MPFIVTEKNLQKVFAEHLHAGENALVVTMSGARGVLGITDQNRIIHTNFPFFGKSKIKEELMISDIFSCECTQKNQYTMTLNIDAKGEKKTFNSTISPMVDSKMLAQKFAAIILEKNGNARPTYLDSEEEIIEQFASKQNTYKISSKNLFQFNKNNELEKKTALTEIILFDSYPGKMESQNLLFHYKDGTQSLINIDTNGYSFLQTESTNPQSLIETIEQLLKDAGSQSRPDYLNSEKLMATLRAGTSVFGAINPSHVLKVTDKRLLDLKVDDNGCLETQLIIDLASIKSSKITRNRGESSGGAIYEIKIILDDKSKHKYTVTEQFNQQVAVLRELLTI
jgi:hypothetical protein